MSVKMKERKSLVVVTHKSTSRSTPRWPYLPLINYFKSIEKLPQRNK